MIVSLIRRCAKYKFLAGLFEVRLIRRRSSVISEVCSLQFETSTFALCVELC